MHYLHSEQDKLGPYCYTRSVYCKSTLQAEETSECSAGDESTCARLIEMKPKHFKTKRVDKTYANKITYMLLSQC